MSGSSRVRRSEIVQPAALNARSLDALVAGTANSFRARVASFGKHMACSFHHVSISPDASRGRRSCRYAVTSSVCGSAGSSVSSYAKKEYFFVSARPGPFTAPRVRPGPPRGPGHGPPGPCRSLVSTLLHDAQFCRYKDLNVRQSTY